MPYAEVVKRRLDANRRDQTDFLGQIHQHHVDYCRVLKLERADIKKIEYAYPSEPFLEVPVGIYIFTLSVMNLPVKMNGEWKLHIVAQCASRNDINKVSPNSRYGGIYLTGRWHSILLRALEFCSPVEESVVNLFLPKIQLRPLPVNNQIRRKATQR